MKKLLIVYSALFICHCANAQSPSKELVNVINASFTYYSKIKEADQLIRISNDKVELAKTYRSPDLSSSASYTYVDPTNVINLPGGKLEINPHNNYNIAISGRYTLYDFGVVKQNIGKAKLDLQNEKDNAGLIKYQIAYQVANLYYGVIYLKKAVEIQDSILLFLYSTQKDVSARIKLGDALRFDLLTIQASIEQQLNEKTNLENSLEKQQTLLGYFTGINNVEEKRFDFTFQKQNGRELFSIASTANYDFIIQRNKIKLAEADVKSASLINKPALQLNAGTGFKNSYTPVITDFKYNYFGGISLAVPLFSGNRVKKSIAVAKSSLALQKLGEASLDSTVNKDITQTFIDINTSTVRLGNTEGQISQAVEAKRLAAIRFKSGVGTNLDIINANTNLQKALLSKLQYQYQLCIANLELARLAGFKFW